MSRESPAVEHSGGIDSVCEEIADYVLDPVTVTADLAQPAVRTAHLVLLDTLACALLALDEPDAVRTAEPLFPATAEHHPRVPGAGWVTDPFQAAHATGVLIRWLDFNDTWLALEWGHPSDNLGAILPLMDHQARLRRSRGHPPPLGADLLRAAVQAHEIQGVLALGTALNRHGLDHVAFTRVASAAVGTRLLGGDREQVRAAITHAWADGGSLRVYRHAPNVTARKSWAAGDAVARAVRLCYLALRGEQSCRHVLTTPTWGFHDALLGGQELTLPRPLGTHIMEHILLKPRFPAEYHGQTAIEAALRLRPDVTGSLESVTRVEIRTHEAAMRIIDKSGPLTGPADRDHCLQYMVAVALLHADVSSGHYHDAVASDPRIDALRERMVVSEDPEYSRAYLDPDDRAVANAIRVRFSDGTVSRWEEVRLPVGHPARRDEAESLVHRKLLGALRLVFDDRFTAEDVASQLSDHERFLATAVDDLVALTIPCPPGARMTARRRERGKTTSGGRLRVARFSSGWAH